MYGEDPDSFHSVSWGGGLLHRYGKFLNLLKDGAENHLALVLKHCERFLKQQQSPVTSSLHILLEWIYAEQNYLPILHLGFSKDVLTYL